MNKLLTLHFTFKLILLHSWLYAQKYARIENFFLYLRLETSPLSKFFFSDFQSFKGYAPNINLNKKQQKLLL